MLYKITQLPNGSHANPIAMELNNETEIPPLAFTRIGLGDYKSQNFAVGSFDPARVRIISPFIEGSYGVSFYKIARIFWSTSGTVFNLFIKIFQVVPSTGIHTPIDIETHILYMEMSRL